MHFRYELFLSCLCVSITVHVIAVMSIIHPIHIKPFELIPETITVSGNERDLTSKSKVPSVIVSSNLVLSDIKSNKISANDIYIPEEWTVVKAGTKSGYKSGIYYFLVNKRESGEIRLFNNGYLSSVSINAVHNYAGPFILGSDSFYAYDPKSLHVQLRTDINYSAHNYAN